jgi:hypothetical protein
MNFQRFFFALAVACVSWSPLLGGNFTAGDIVVLRMGNGSAISQFTAAPVSLLEFSPAGALVQTINFPSSGGGTLLTGSYGLTMTEGFLSRSADGQYLVYPGYNTAAGTGTVRATSVPRVIARIGPNGVPDLSTSTTSVPGTSVTGVASVDGTRFWMTADNTSSTVPQITTMTFGSSGAATTVAAGSTSTAFYAPRVINGQLYVTDINSALVRTNTALPTGASGVTTVQAYNIGAGSLYPGEYVFLDRSATVAGIDTLYITGNNGLQKFSFDGTNWTARGSVAGNYFGLTGKVNGSNATLFGTDGNGTTANNNFGTFTDTAAFNANISASFTPLVSAGANFIFNGTEFSPTPVPEPVGMMAAAGILATFAARRKLTQR